MMPFIGHHFFLKCMKQKIISMNAKRIIGVILCLFVVTVGYSQEKTRKQLRTESKIEKGKQISVLVDAKEFVFVANRAFPQGFRSIDLTTNTNFIEFKPAFIKSEMPFFGRGYSGIGFGGDKGLKFEGKPSEFSIVKTKKTYELNATVRGEGDVFRITLSILFEGSATLSIYSNNRSAITYYGEIFKIENKNND